jgi:hypothetical protein
LSSIACEAKSKLFPKKTKKHAPLHSVLCEFRSFVPESFCSYQSSIKVLILSMSLVSSKPQDFGSSFTSSQLISPTGEVIGSSQYIDSNGNHAINGVVQNIPLELAPTGTSVELLNRPDWATNGNKVVSKNSDDQKTIWQ